MAPRKTAKRQDSEGSDVSAPARPLVVEGGKGLVATRIGKSFNKRPVVRDVSLELGKDIDLQISGADTELDKTVVEKIGDPLMHLLRNAMDHGIESPEVRQAAGKPLKGRLSLNAYHDSGSIVIEIVDDGAGLDRERILHKARERGLIAATATPSDQDIYNLIFEPGFSTAAAVTNLSGRGVGMERREAEDPGQGRILRARPSPIRVAFPWHCPPEIRCRIEGGRMQPY